MCLDGRGESVFYCALHNKMELVAAYKHAATVRGTADRGDVAAYVLPRVRLCTRRSPVAAHITPLRRPRKCC